LLIEFCKFSLTKEPLARGYSEWRDGVDPLDRESRGLSSERARRARVCTQRAPAVLVEKPTEGSQAQQHLRD
jgi:hypothetical protein